MLSWAVLLAGIGAGIASAYIVINTYSPLPHWDEWALFDHLAKGGSWSLSWLWAQHNEHRILTTKIFFLLDVQLFRGTQIFLLTCIFLVQLLQVALLSWSLRAFGGWRGSLWRVGTGLIAYCILCPTQYENLVWGFQVQFVMTACMATLAIASLLLYQRDDRTKYLVTSIAAATIATWSLANGMLLWPLLIVASLWLRMRAHVWRTLLVAGALNLGLYFFHYHRSSGDTGLAPIGKSLRYVGVYFGSTFVRHSSGLTAVLAGIAGLLAAAVLIVAALRRRDDSSPLANELALLMLFTLATAAITSTGRLHLGVEQATASRYQTFALLFWCCLGLAILARVSGSSKQQWLAAGLCIAMLAFATQVRLPLIDAQWRQLRLKKISLALLTGVHDDDLLAEGFPDPQLVLRSADYMRQHQLSIFAGPDASLLGKPFAQVFHEVPSTACFGALDSEEILPTEDGQAMRLNGYAWDNSRQQPAKDILVVTEGKVTGFGIVTVYPLILAREHDPATAPRFEWIAYSIGSSARVSELYVLSGHDRKTACPFVAVSP
jgi:hypothetical protein